MRLLSIFMVYFLTFCDGYKSTTTNNLEKFALDTQFINSIQNYTTNNKNSLSEQCELDLKDYVKALSKPKLWAWLMFDAGTKIPSGILSGNVVDLGQFDQCMNIENKIQNTGTISGKYCLVSFSLFSKMFELPETKLLNPSGVKSSMFATCLPSSCNTTDIEKLYSWMGIKIEVYDLFCQSKSTQPKLTAGDIATITFLFIIFCLMLVSTIYDVFLFYMNKDTLHPLLISFSVLTNGKKLFTTSQNPAQISCLSGIRVISMIWIILSHRYLLASLLPIRNFLHTIQWMFDAKNMFIMGATVAVDTFFVLSGLLLAYTFMTSTVKGAKFNILLYYLHRFLRLTPVLAVIILIHVTILKHLGSGPLWKNDISLLSAPCEKHWWSTLLYIQNFVNPEDMCIGQTWYLSVDTQLYLLSPILLIPLKRWPKFGIIFTAILVFASMLSNFLIAWFNEFYGFIVANPGEKLNDYRFQVYFQVHTRAGPWLMGIILGYYIFQIKYYHKKIPMNKILALILWIIALVILGACLYTGHNTMKLTYKYDRLANSFYMALLRPGWALGICWIIFACVTGYGGSVNWFLSLPIFQVLAKLTYTMYLIHITMEMLVSSQNRTSVVFSDLVTIYTFWGDLAFTIAASLIFSLAFESPIIVLEKIIFGTRKKEKCLRTESSTDNNRTKMEDP